MKTSDIVVGEVYAIKTYETIPRKARVEAVGVDETYWGKDRIRYSASKSRVAVTFLDAAERKNAWNQPTATVVPSKVLGLWSEFGPPIERAHAVRKWRDLVDKYLKQGNAKATFFGEPCTLALYESRDGVFKVVVELEYPLPEAIEMLGLDGFPPMVLP